MCAFFVCIGKQEDYVMNNKERNYRIAYEALMILAAIALLSFICRLWPIIILALVGTIAAALPLLLL